MGVSCLIPTLWQCCPAAAGGNTNAASLWAACIPLSFSARLLTCTNTPVCPGAVAVPLLPSLLLSPCCLLCPADKAFARLRPKTPKHLRHLLQNNKPATQAPTRPASKAQTSTTPRINNQKNVKVQIGRHLLNAKPNTPVATKAPQTAPRKPQQGVEAGKKVQG